MCSFPSTSSSVPFREMSSSSCSSAVDSSRTNSDSGKTIVPESNEPPAFHKLSNKWTLWAHLPHDTNWSASSYKKIFEFESAEEAIAIFETLPPKLVMNCMLFLMRKGIVPMW